MPSATTGSPTATFAGAARSPSSASPSTASCACTCARVCVGAGVPRSATVCRGSMTMWATHAGGCTVSSRDTPVKSSMYTCTYLGSACRASAGSSPHLCSSLRRAIQRSTAGGGGCVASKSACLRRTHAATSVEMRSN
eukprot:1952954-Pleurochrysis_carterae.AAC.1